MVTPEPPAMPVRCPECSSLEGVPVVNIRSYSIAHDGKVIEEVIGYRIACQRCPKIYSVTGTGIFRQHPQSSPLTPEARPVREDHEQPDPNGVIPPGALRPMPKPRPVV